MPSWNELFSDIEKQPGETIRSLQQQSMNKISELRGGRNVIFYASGWLQKPDNVPGHFLQITHEDINGFMSVMFNMNWQQNLTPILHTPGGVTNAAEMTVAYICLFSDIEVIVPTMAMSAGTMIALSGPRIVMGRQSQLGPIDPQMPVAGRFVSAQSVVDQFERAKSEVLQNPAPAHVWAPVLQSIGPAVLQEAHDALAYGERMVQSWLEQRMFFWSR